MMSATLTVEEPRKRGIAAPLIKLERVALLGSVLIALLIMRLPLRRAVRFKPGEAIRYA